MPVPRERLQRLPNQFIPWRTVQGCAREASFDAILFALFCAKSSLLIRLENAELSFRPRGPRPTRNKRFGPLSHWHMHWYVHREMSVCLDESIT